MDMLAKTSKNVSSTSFLSNLTTKLKTSCFTEKDNIFNVLWRIRVDAEKDIKFKYAMEMDINSE